MAVTPRSDASRFADWVSPSILAMTRLARRLAPDADPDDVVQDALVRAWQKWHLFDVSGSIAGATLIGCSGAVAEQERTFHAILTGSATWSLSGGVLTITATGVGALVFARS